MAPERSTKGRNIVDLDLNRIRRRRNPSFAAAIPRVSDRVLGGPPFGAVVTVHLLCGAYSARHPNCGPSAGVPGPSGFLLSFRHFKFWWARGYDLER